MIEEFIVELFFYNHCEDEDGVPCGLGSVWYDCPVCKKNSIDYGQLWFKYEDGYKDAETSCENCGAEFFVNPIVNGDDLPDILYPLKDKFMGYYHPYYKFKLIKS